MAKKSKAEAAMEEIILTLMTAGWTRDGETNRETVRIPTTRCPLSCGGKAGGEVVTLGGRARFKDADGNQKVTVGKRSTYFFLPDREKKWWQWHGKGFKTIHDREEILNYIRRSGRPDDEPRPIL